MKIIIEDHGDHFCAFEEDNPDVIFGIGRTSREALGRLVFVNKENYGIHTIEERPERCSCEDPTPSQPQQ